MTDAPPLTEGELEALEIFATHQGFHKEAPIFRMTAELRRLRAPVESQEITDTIHFLNLAIKVMVENGHNKRSMDCRIAVQLIQRLSRELAEAKQKNTDMERLKANYDERVGGWIDTARIAGCAVTAAEARAERLRVALRSIASHLNDPDKVFGAVASLNDVAYTARAALAALDGQGERGCRRKAMVDPLIEAAAKAILREIQRQNVAMDELSPPIYPEQIARVVLSAVQAQGLKIVAREPTEKMTKTGDYWGGPGTAWPGPEWVWKRMFDAAPPLPPPPGER